LVATAAHAQAPDSFRFALIGDRTGETRPGVYQQVWRELAEENPAFVVSVGDTIQGLNDRTAEAEWREIENLLAPYRRLALYLAPGNHDIWSVRSAALFQKYAAHPLHYSFDYRQAHFTILDNSRSEQLSAEELAFLEADLKAHAAQPLKFVISHRPSWLVNVVLRDRKFTLHQLARKYGVQYVIAGHIHQMLHVDLEGVTYVSLASSGGALRASERYQDGWFFQHSLVEVDGNKVSFEIRELKPGYGQGRITTPADWGVTGLVDKIQNAAAAGK
jgi:predicted phosphodiesterase